MQLLNHFAVVLSVLPCKLVHKGKTHAVDFLSLMVPTYFRLVENLSIVSFDSFICENTDSFLEVDFPKRCVPTQTQIRQQLGSKLSDVFFEYVADEGKAYLGLEPPLVGPDTVWVNPNARLQNTVAITPVPEPKVLHLKSLMHGAVLELGEKYIQKLENQHRMEIEDALRKQAEELEEDCRRRYGESNESVAGNDGQCKKVVGTLMEHFDNCFNDLVKATQLRMRKEYQVKVNEERAEMAAYMMSQLQEEVERRDVELCEEFHDILYNELNILASRYIKQINTERETAVGLIRETVRNYEKMLTDQRIEMQLSGMVDICRAITQERKSCGERIRQLENEIRLKQNDCLRYIEELRVENCTLQKMSTERLKRLMQWRQKVRELLQEFQRFINFALESVPGQSEFMLNMENLMLRKFPEDSFLLPEDYLHFKNCIEGKLASDEELKPQEVAQPSEETQRVVEDGTLGESSGERTPPYCRKPLYEEGAEPGLTFDYDFFKSLVKRQVCSSKPSRKVRKPKKAVCLWRKKTGELSIDKSSELYRMMTLAGENEKEHLFPVDCFLHKRLKAVRRICQDDPEFATVILGCSRK